MSNPTMADIAAHLGVSRPLVSIVLRDVPGASAETRERVLQAARDLGYTPHQGAQSLRRTRSQHLGVTFDPGHASEAEIVRSIYDAAAEHGYQVILSARTPNRGPRQTAEELLTYRCAALIQVGPDLSHRELSNLVDRLPVPTVLVGPGLRNAAFDIVCSDGAHGIAGLVDHLHTLGHRRYAYIHCPTMPSAADRLHGFLSATARHRASARIIKIEGEGYTEEAGSAAARKLTQLTSSGDRAGTADPAGEQPTALVAGNDQQAIGAMWVLTRAGFKIPEDLSVTGYDDSRYARLSAVDLSTASQDTGALGGLAVQAALCRIREPDLAPQLVTVEPHLIIRSSTAPPAA